MVNKTLCLENFSVHNYRKTLIFFFNDNDNSYTLKSVDSFKKLLKYYLLFNVNTSKKTKNKGFLDEKNRCFVLELFPY